MKSCDRCGAKFDYVEGINHRCYTVKEWKKFATNPVQAETNEFQFVNFFTQEKESYDYITTAEVLLARHVIIIRDHTNRKRVGRFAKTPMKEKLKDGLKSLPSKMTMQNFDKGMKAFDKGMADFNKSMDQFGEGIGGKNSASKKSKMEKLWGSSNKKNNMDFITGNKSKSNLEKIWGTPSKKKKSSSVKIWSDKPVQKRKTKRKSKSHSEKWDKHENNLTKIWGKRK